MVPDIECAKKCYSSVYGYSKQFKQYSPGYTTTNENLRNAYSLMPKNTENVLTVAASGDHPMFASLYDAKNIDTFDITYNAKCIMDIKTEALQVLNYKEYLNLQEDLYSAVDVKNVKNMDKIFDKLPIEEQNYMNAMRGFFLFNHGLANYKKSLLVSESEYAQMREKIKKPFNFIWSDITSLHNHLDKQYGFIHLSNIFDHLDQDTQITVLFNMMKYVCKDGVICIVSGNDIPLAFYDYYKKHNPKSTECWKVSNPFVSLRVFQRVR